MQGGECKCNGGGVLVQSILRANKELSQWNSFKLLMYAN
jgi:hypothetical protein